MREGITPETELVKSDIPEDVKIYNGDILFSWSASLEVMIWTGGEGGLNQHIFKVVPKASFNKPFVFYQILDYIKVFQGMAEARKTTMGHITQDHLNQSLIVIPKYNSLLLEFEKLISPVFNQLILNSEQISDLKVKREELLPLLMNGQVSVKPTEIN